MLVAAWLRAWARRMAKTTCVRLLRGVLLSTSLAVPWILHLRMSRRFHRGFLVWSLGGLGSCSPGRQLARLRSRNATEIDVSEVYFRSDVVSCLNTPVFRIGLRALCFRLDPSLIVLVQRSDLPAFDASGDCMSGPHSSSLPAAMLSPLRSALWRCRLRHVGAVARCRLRALPDSLEFVHVVTASNRVVNVFVHDPRKPVLSTLEELVPGARWRRVEGPGSAQAMWDLVGDHFVRGPEPCPGSRGDLDGSQGLLDARRLLGSDWSRPQDVHDVQLVELWAGKGRVSGVIAALGFQAVRVGYAWGKDFLRLAHRRDVDGLLQRAQCLSSRGLR